MADDVAAAPLVARHQRPGPARGEAGANETTGARKRKMKRVRILPKDGLSTKARGSSARFSSQDLQERSLLVDSNETNNNDGSANVPDKSETREVLKRARLRSRTSSGLLDLSSSTSSIPSLSVESIRQSFRRPSRTISNLTSISTSSLQLLSRGEDERRVLHRARTPQGDRVDAVMKAPPHMKGGLVVIRSYCR